MPEKTWEMDNFIYYLQHHKMIWKIHQKMEHPILLGFLHKNISPCVQSGGVGIKVLPKGWNLTFTKNLTFWLLMSSTIEAESQRYTNAIEQVAFPKFNTFCHFFLFHIPSTPWYGNGPSFSEILKGPVRKLFTQEWKVTSRQHTG